MLADPGANAALAPAHLGVERWNAGDHLHVSGYSLLRAQSRPAALHGLDAARARGMTVSLDASSAAPLRQAGPHRIVDNCRAGDLVFANADEAAVLTGQSSPDRAAASLAAQGLVAVVKLGEQGAIVAREGSLTRGTAKRTTVVDTTGAGDAFAAGFLRAWRSGADDEAALVEATRLAACAVGQAGARP